MAFVVEAPGAALPFSYDSLRNTLQSANSLDYSQRQAAGQQLVSPAWQAHAEYYPTLQTIFLDNTLPRDIRFLAIIQLKNGIDSCWRNAASKNAIPRDQKQIIRSRLFRGSIEELDPQLALHNALVIAKIVRVDFPTEWPDALNILIEQLKALQYNDQALAGALLIVLRIVRELGTARLLRSQKALQAAAPELVQVLAEIYDAKSRVWLAFMSGEHGDESSAAAAMVNSLAAFKILRRLVVTGYEFPHREGIVQQIWAFTQTQFAQLLNLVNDKYPLVGEHLLQFTKFHIEMANSHPASFAALPGSLELVRSYWNIVTEFSQVYEQSEGLRHGGASSETKSKAEGPLLEKFALKGLLLMRACVKLAHHPVLGIKYRSKEDAVEQQEAIRALKVQLFPDGFVNQMAHTIITHLLVFRKADWDAWQEDPEDWEQREESEGNAYEYEVRPCAERLFLDLLTNYRELLTAPLVAYFATAHDPQTTMVAKEAIYTTLGLAACLVGDTFDFDGLIKSVIAADASLAVPMCQIIRRRIAIVLSQLTRVKLSSESLTLIWEIFTHLLNSNDAHNDIVVRITAARQFKVVVDQMESQEGFNPTPSADMFKELTILVQTAEVDETKLAIMETLRVLITRMERNVEPFGDLIMTALPEIWQSAGDQNFMMKQAVLTTLVSLLCGMRTAFQRYHGSVLPLIIEATQPGTESYHYLIDDALDLWVNILQSSQPPLSPDLLNLASVAINLLADQTEQAQICVSIVGAYVTLAPQTLLDDRHRQPLLKSLLICLESQMRDMVIAGTKYLDLAMRISHQLGGSEGFRVLVQDMMEVGIFKHILEAMRESHEAHQTSGPKRKQSRLESFHVGSYFSILARMAAIDPADFVTMIGAFGSIESVWPWLTSEWFEAFDTMAEYDQLKLNLVGITRLLELPQPMAGLVLTKLQDYMSMWTNVVVHIWDPETQSTEGPRATEPDAWATYLDTVEFDLNNTDPVRTVNHRTFVMERLQALSQTVGDATYQEWLGNVDKEVVDGWQNIGR